MNLDKELQVAKKLAIIAGGAIINVYNDLFEVKYKEDESPVTLADRKADKIIVDGLKKEFPQYAILSEESEDDKSRLNNDWCWIVDPLDGTKEFIKKNGEFTVNIALAYKHRVVLGVIYIPTTSEMYYAAEGIGAFYETKHSTEKISVSHKTDKLRLVKSRSHATDSLENLIERNKHKISSIKEAGSSIKGCLIAKGDAEVYYRYSLTKEWDTAAMQCVVEKAGGVFRQMDDTEMTYNRENSFNEKGFYILNKIENKLI